MQIWLFAVLGVITRTSAVEKDRDVQVVPTSTRSDTLKRSSIAPLLNDNLARQALSTNQCSRRTSTINVTTTTTITIAPTPAISPVPTLAADIACPGYNGQPFVFANLTWLMSCDHNTTLLGSSYTVPNLASCLEQCLAVENSCTAVSYIPSLTPDISACFFGVPVERRDMRRQEMDIMWAWNVEVVDTIGNPTTSTLTGIGDLSSASSNIITSSGTSSSALASSLSVTSAPLSNTVSKTSFPSALLTSSSTHSTIPVSATAILATSSTISPSPSSTSAPTLLPFPPVSSAYSQTLRTFGVSASGQSSFAQVFASAVGKLFDDWIDLEEPFAS